MSVDVITLVLVTLQILFKAAVLKVKGCLKNEVRSIRETISTEYFSCYQEGIYHRQHFDSALLSIADALDLIEFVDCNPNYPHNDGFRFKF